ELSPETIQNLKSIQDNVRTDVVIKAPPDSIVYLNGKLGKEVWGKHTFKSRRGSSQVSVLAPGLGWEQREIEIGSEPVSISMAGRKMIDGRCDSARALDQSSSMTFVAYLQEQACFVKIQAGQAAPLAQPLRLPLSPGKETAGPSLSAQQSQYFSDSTPSMWKSPWLWLGIGTLAGAIIMISESQKKERVVVPSHGFQF
ncbi:MAG: hypothetical protein IT289_05385, partial [Oligoflexia bacterium]|nr:hypothetical protein [Oligoflexia bacterium]